MSMTTTLPSRPKTTESSSKTVPTLEAKRAGYAPIEDFQTIDGLLKSHAAQQIPSPLICYPAQGVDDYEEHTAAQLDQHTDAAVSYYIDHGLEPADIASERAPVIAMLAPSSFEVVLTIFALNRLGYACLFLSTRLTAPAYARLLDMADCRTIVHTPNFNQMIPDINNDRPACTGIPIVRRQDWHDRHITTPTHQQSDDDRSRQASKIGWILHSSGSTGFPKPIFLTNLQCLANARKSFGLRAFCASPLFHSGGLMELFRAFYTRSIMYLANHSFPVTSNNLLSAIKVAKPELVIAVPYVLKLLAEKPEGVQALANAELVLFNGSGCPDDLGDRLVANGVNLVANYGATETGQIMTSFRPAGDNNWNYLRLWPPVAEHVLMDEVAPGVFECVGLDGLPSKGPSNSQPPFNESNPENSFRTADLFTRHPDPEKSNYYKYLSRADDRITLYNGEKVLPLPMEGRIRQEDFVREAVVFGFQQALPGVLVFRPEDKVTEMSDEEYLELVWPAVEAANARAETFSHIIKELVIIKGPESVYPRTDKGTFIRAQVYQQFANDIKAVYGRLEKADQGKEKLSLDVAELEAWLLARFREDLHIPLKDAHSDIFAAGVDSLQTTRIWRSIKQKLDLGAEGESLGTNIVFEKGTVSALAQHLHGLRTGEAFVTDDDEIEVMQQLIDKYSSFTPHTPSDPPAQPSKGEVVIVTGATGNLGPYILADLLARPDVAEVWALVRAPERYDAAGRRVFSALKSHNLTISDEQRFRLCCVRADFSRPDLGLGLFDTRHLQERLTCVIHSAWAVNFNLGVRSFEEQHIKGTHNLINFCLSSKQKRPAKFYFCSSVSVGSGTPKPASIPEAPIPDLRHAQKTGYGRSKLVAESITLAAARTANMDARVLRIGQLSGDRQSGIWNDTEAIPLMIRSALTVRALPALDESPSWLPVDVCAQACVDIALAARPRITNASSSTIQPATQDEGQQVYHLVNPVTLSWKTDLLGCLQQFQQHSRFPSFDIVSPSEWLKRLATSEQDPAKNPSIKLLDFWRGKYGSSSQPPDDDDEPAGLIFETKWTVGKCSALAEVKDPVTEGLMEKYVDVWMKKWTQPVTEETQPVV